MTSRQPRRDPAAPAPPAGPPPGAGPYGPYEPRAQRTWAPAQYRQQPRRPFAASALAQSAATASGLAFLAGVWLILAPYVLNYSNTGNGFNGYWNDVVIGVAAAAVALVRLTTPARTAVLSVVNVALGGWLIAAPFVLNYNAGIDAPAAMWNDIIVGAILAGLAMISLAAGVSSDTEARAAEYHDNAVK